MKLWVDMAGWLFFGLMGSVWVYTWVGWRITITKQNETICQWRETLDCQDEALAEWRKTIAKLADMERSRDYWKARYQRRRHHPMHWPCEQAVTVDTCDTDTWN